MTTATVPTATDLPEGWTVVESDGIRVLLRKGEDLVEVRPAGRFPLVCQCGKGLAAVRTRWADKTGSNGHWFETTRHIDGTGCGIDDLGIRNGDGAYSPAPRYHGWAKPVCAACGSIDTKVVVQRAYGDDVTCSACGDSHYYSIGD